MAQRFKVGDHVKVTDKASADAGTSGVIATVTPGTPDATYSVKPDGAPAFPATDPQLTATK